MAICYLETGSLDPCYNLAAEQFVLERKRAGDWLMLWQNERTVVLGLNQNAREEIDEDFVRRHGVTVVRRMSGGGAVYHDLGNLNYSFIGDLDDAAALRMERFTAPVCRALAALGVEAEASGRNDILVDGKKISGVAQRLFGRRILHHGTLLFDVDEDMLSGCLRPAPGKFESKSTKSVRARVGRLRPLLPPGTTMADFRAAILRELTAEGLEPQTLTAAEREEVERLAERYRSWDWTYGRAPDYRMRSRRRFSGGSLEVRLDAAEGRIRDIVFLGDYMAADSDEALRAALRGQPVQREALAAVLEGFALGPVLGGISAGELLDTILGQEESHG